MATTFNNAQVSLTTTATTDVYQCPSTAGNTAVVMSLMVANVNGVSSADITISKTDSSNNLQSYLAYTIPVPADTTLECVANRVVLKAGEKIRATASSGNYFYVTASVVENT